jgi:hypothetical protein
MRFAETNGDHTMKHIRLTVVSILALAVLAGCASSDVSARRSYVGDEEIARPERIIVHSFAATPADIPKRLRRSRSAGSWGIKSPSSWSRKSRTWASRPSWREPGRDPRSATS